MKTPAMEPARPVDTVLFLGAGASDFAGYQTFRGFGDLILDPLLRYKEGLPSIAPETPRLISEIHEALERMQRPATHDNYLWLLTEYNNFCEKFDTHTALQERFPPIKDDVRSFHALSTSAINDLTKTTFCHYSRYRKADARTEIRSLYEELAILNDNNAPFLPVFTTNYDLLIEDTFDEAYNIPGKLVLYNGIPGCTRPGTQWSSDAYQDTGISLYRLHGCIAWFCNGHEQASAPVWRRSETIDTNLLSRMCVMFPGREIEHGRDPHGFGFKLLFNSLLHCRRVLFIGFSFRDDDVMQVLLAANALRDEPLTILIIDPRLTRGDVLRQLEGAARRSASLVRIPSEGNVRSKRMRFGEANCRNDVLEFIQSA
jgi:hypothetical protein